VMALRDRTPEEEVVLRDGKEHHAEPG